MAHDADVIVVGGGLAGLVATAELADAARCVILPSRSLRPRSAARRSGPSAGSSSSTHPSSGACACATPASSRSRTGWALRPSTARRTSGRGAGRRPTSTSPRGRSEPGCTPRASAGCRSCSGPSGAATRPTSRALGAPRTAPSAARTSPVTPSMPPAVVLRLVTRWRKRSSTRPLATPSRTRRSKGSTSPGPVPQVMWKRGTELPCPWRVHAQRPGRHRHFGAVEHITRNGHEHSWFLLNQRIIDNEFALSGSEQNPDLTERDVRELVRRALPSAATSVGASRSAAPTSSTRARCPSSCARRTSSRAESR